MTTIPNITIDGLTFRVEIEPDNDTAAPWDNEDGHGPVSEWTTRAKRPGERVINSDHGSHRYYDVQEAMQIARREGWGLGDEARAELAARLGREPTKREVTAEAVERDCDRLRRWCAGDWYYVGVVVTLLDVDGNETDETRGVWGIDSDSDDYLDEVAQELAQQIARQFEGRDVITKTVRVTPREPFDLMKSMAGKGGAS